MKKSSINESKLKIVLYEGDLEIRQVKIIDKILYVINIKITVHDTELFYVELITSSENLLTRDVLGDKICYEVKKKIYLRPVNTENPAPDVLTTISVDPLEPTRWDKYKIKDMLLN